MDKYFCVFKLAGDSTPSRTSFESQHPGTAILKMMDLANVKSTMELEEAEILKCVKLEDGKTGYIPVFVKEKDQKKGRAILTHQQAAPTPAVNLPAVIEKPADTYQKPYIIEVL